MKKNVISGFIVFLIALLIPQITGAQGTVYVSGLSQTSTGSHSVGSDSWLAADFETGTNASGYVLNSVELALINASGNPNGFTAMLYTQVGEGGVNPGSSLGAFSGSSNPSTSDIYVYTAPPDFILSPNTFYNIVVTSQTLAGTGSYNWSDSTFPPNLSGGWRVSYGVLYSNNGAITDWYAFPVSGYAQFSIDAISIPEPGVLSLFGLGGVFLFGIFCRRCQQRIGSR
jgi:hypothetical protein